MTLIIHPLVGGGVVDGEAGSSSRKAESVWGHGVFPVHHAPGHSLCLAVPPWSHGLPLHDQQTRSIGPHRTDCGPLHHLPFLDSGLYDELIEHKGRVHIIL